MFPSRLVSKSVLCNNAGKSAKNRGLKIDTEVVLHGRLDGRPKLVISAAVSGVEVTDLQRFQLCLHKVHMNRGSLSDLIIMKAVVIHMQSFSILYAYEVYCITIGEVVEILAHVCEYDCYVYNTRAVKGIGNRRQAYSSKNTSEHDGSKAEGQGGDDLEIVDVS